MNEVIVMDNRSPDVTAEIAKKLAQKYSPDRLKVMEMQLNKG